LQYVLLHLGTTSSGYIGLVERIDAIDTRILITTNPIFPNFSYHTSHYVLHYVIVEVEEGHCPSHIPSIISKDQFKSFGIDLVIMLLI